MRYSELRKKPKEELENALKGLRAELSKAYFELANNTLKNTSVIKKTKKDIARILTAVKQLQKTKIYGKYK